MKNTRRYKIIALLALLVLITGCAKVYDGGRVTIKEPDKTITVIDEVDSDSGKSTVAVVKIERFEDIEISDWLNENTLIVSKENTTLDKLTIFELANTYPRSLYTYRIDQGDYQLLKELKNGSLGGAKLSSDKKNLLYYEFTVGDPAFYVMHMDTQSTFNIRGSSIAEAMSAKWAKDDTVVGAAYSGGAYIATPSGTITAVENLKDKLLVIVDKIKNAMYYNTNADESLWKMDLSSMEKTDLKMNQVYDLLPSPDGNMLLVSQGDGAETTLSLFDTDGGNKKVIAKGIEVDGVSWSPDQRFIAYNLMNDVNGKTNHGLYIYDMLTGVTTQIAVDVQAIVTIWSPNGEKLVYTEFDGKQYDSSMIYLQFSLSK